MKLAKIAVLSLLGLALAVPAAAGPAGAVPPVLVADFDGDGQTDVLVQDSSSGQLWIYLTAANGTSFISGGSPVVVPGGWSVVGVADFNADDRADVLVQDGSGLLYTYITAAGGITFNSGASGSPVTIPSGFEYVGSGDYTADVTGALNDIVVINSTTDLVYIYATGADGITVDAGSSGNPVTLQPGYSIVGIADFTGDGIVDTLIENGSKLLYVFKHSGPGTIDDGSSGSPVTIPGTFDLAVPITL